MKKITTIWKKPGLTSNDILAGITEYGEVSYLRKINDSMELDSAGESLAWMSTSFSLPDGKKYEADVDLRVQGDVRVIFRGEVYRCASKMPKELLDCYHNGIDPTTIDPNYVVDNNNWLEMFMRITDGEEALYDISDVVDDSGDSDWKTGFADSILSVVNYADECLASFFNVGDTVRWNDPDRSLAWQMSEDELTEYCNREYKVISKREDMALIADDVSEMEVLYSELLLPVQAD